MLGNVDFSALFIDLSGKGYTSLAQAQAAGAPVIKYGAFVNSVIDFLIVAFVVFLLVKQINKLKKPVPPQAQPEAKEAKLLAEIRDLLKNR